jgi:large subunit ribosomal protein L7/L12
MADTAKLLEELEGLTVLELVELTKQIEDKWGVSAAPVAGGFAMPAGGAPAGGGEEAPAAEEKDEFTVHMSSFGSNKIAVIKEVRGAVAGLGLAEAKKMVEGAPVDVAENVSKDEAEEIKKKLEAAGATIELK